MGRKAELGREAGAPDCIEALAPKHHPMRQAVSQSYDPIENANAPHNDGLTIHMQDKAE